MKSKGKIVKMAYAKTGFTIIELLTVMSIIIILIAMLVPSLNAVRRYARVVTQNGQFHDISKGLEMFSINFDGYPDSSWSDGNESYCGAMKLCEALVGQDGLGFHPDSIFDDEGEIGGTELYYVRNNDLTDPPTSQEKVNLRNRKVYLEGEVVQVASIPEIFDDEIGAFSNGGGWSVLCDVFKRNDLRRANGEKLGMPVLYYRAEATKLTHEYDEMATNIYNYFDNHELLEILPPWISDSNDTHPLYDQSVAGSSGGPKFYDVTTNPNVIVKMGTQTYPQPYNKNSYILISAGWDGLYGTRDDVFNFVE